MRKSVAVLGGILVSFTILWLVLEGGNPPETPVLPGRTTGKAPNPPPLLSKDHPGKGKSRKKGETPKRKEVELPPAERPWKVLVVEKATGKPVPKARVMALDLSKSSYSKHIEYEIRRTGVRAIKYNLLRDGKNFWTDRQGVAWIPPLEKKKGVYLGARKGFRWALLEGKEIGNPPLTLELAPSPVAVVQVVDADGRPRAGIPVRFKFQGRLHTEYNIFETKAPEGKVFVGEEKLHNLRPKAREVFLASLAFPCRDKTWKEGVLAPFPGKPVVLHLPPTGSVEVLVQTSKGPVPDDRYFVYLESVDPEKPGKPYISFLDFFREDWVFSRDVLKGKALFPFVETGLTLRAILSPLGRGSTGSPPPPSMVKQGPTGPGEKVSFLFHVRERSSISGRILFPSGMAVSERKVTIQIQIRCPDGSTPRSSFKMETDKRGRFRLDLPWGKSQAGDRTLTVILPPSPSRGTMLGRVDLSRDFPPGVTDLGDIHLTEFPLLASGKVMDSGGNPIGGAEVIAWEKAPSPLVLWPSGPSGIPEIETRTDEKGGFRIFGKPVSGTATLQAFKEGWFPSQEKTVREGEKNVRLFLGKGTSLTVEVTLPKGVSLMDLSSYLDILRPGGRHRWYKGRVSGKNRWTWEGLHPGKGELKVFLEGSDYPFLRVPDILVPPGGKCRDPRIHPLDLRDKIQVSLLEVMDPKGRSIPEFTVYWGKDWKSRIERLAGQALLLPKGDFSSIWVEAKGYRPRKIPVPSGRAWVTLEPGYPIRLIYTGKLPYPKKPHQFTVTLQLVRPATGPGMPDLKKDPTFFAQGGFFLSDKSLRMSVPFPGTYKVEWTLCEVTLNSESPLFSFDGTPREIHVADTPSIQEFRVSPDRESFEKERNLRKSLRRFKESR